ncbi:CLUMA_CG003869, isoform A [Clunio marinus]|uniref:CLUMA_CG003869, isoform A n=1 Tax=Clunio marinus TaxID=568069 RepID=A0A1J1HVH2_9DIPT|nr:CLUMA_CG003869, isoform A [Clunio marinus]
MFEGRRIDQYQTHVCMAYSVEIRLRWGRNYHIFATQKVKHEKAICTFQANTKENANPKSFCSPLSDLKEI